MAKILIIDDDPEFIDILKIVIEREQHQVVTAFNGEEGLQKVETENPDLIILDVMMETEDKGFEVARELKQNSNYKNIPILMITGIEEKCNLDFKSEAGDEIWLPVDSYIDKTSKLDNIIFKVRELLKT